MAFFLIHREGGRISVANQDGYHHRTKNNEERIQMQPMHLGIEKCKIFHFVLIDER